MLQELHLQGLGPTESLDMVLGERLNVLTGDNGLGKTFLLDICWRTMHGVWAGDRVTSDRSRPSNSIWWRQRGEPVPKPSSINADGWIHGGGRTKDGPRPLVVYARYDGGICVGDPLRGGLLDDGGVHHSGAPYRFSVEELWQGLPLDEPRKLCNGLLADWILWQFSPDQQRFNLFRKVLSHLSESEQMAIVPSDEVARASSYDVRPIPTLATPYGTVPVTQASAAVRRILGLAYAMVWTWTEHAAHCESVRRDPCREMLFLLDEVECHLHPFWQRRLLPALLSLGPLLADGLDVQYVVSTHSPLVLASLEPHFDETRDKLWTFELDQGKVNFRELPWVRQGEVANWLTSDVFDLPSSRSLEAERAILDASALMRGEDTDRPVEEVQAALEASLAQHDRFWPRWVGFLERTGRDPR